MYSVLEFAPAELAVGRFSRSADDALPLVAVFTASVAVAQTIFFDQLDNPGERYLYRAEQLLYEVKIEPRENLFESEHTLPPYGCVNLLAGYKNVARKNRHQRCGYSVIAKSDSGIGVPAGFMFDQPSDTETPVAHEPFHIRFKCGDIAVCCF